MTRKENKSQLQSSDPNSPGGNQGKSCTYTHCHRSSILATLSGRLTSAAMEEHVQYFSVQREEGLQEKDASKVEGEKND